MRLVFITDTMHSGGAERVISVLANYFSDKYNVEIICLRGDKTFYALKDSIRIIYLECICGNNLLNKFLWLYRNIKSDMLVIPFMVNVYIFTLTALLFRRVKVIISERNDPRKHKLPIRFMRKLLIWRAQRIVVQTRDIAEYFPKLIQNRIDVVYNPISEKYLWKSACSDNKSKIIVTVGRLSPQKNHKMLINAFFVINKYYPEYQLHIYGDGEARKETESYIKSKGLSGSIILKGNSSTLETILPKAEIFVLSSDYEGMSNALIEAMYVGLPIVTTSVSGTKDLIENGENGFVVPIRDEKAFINAVLKLIENKDLRERFSQKGVDIINKVQPSIIFKQWDDIITQVWNK